MSARRALITGIAGQDGSYLAELLLEQGYAVFGAVRRDPSEHFENLSAIRDRVELVQADLLDQLSLVNALEQCEPDEVYNLASVSFVPMSWDQPVLTAQFAAVGVTAMLAILARPWLRRPFLALLRLFFRAGYFARHRRAPDAF